MNRKAFWLSVVAVCLSFIGGFLLANALNKSELNSLRAESERLKNSQTEPNNDAEPELSVEEIRQKISEADKNPNNLTFQKNLGLALYRYTAMKQDTKLLADVEKLLLRAHQLEQKDYDILVALANLYLDIADINKDNQSFAKSREFFQKALEIRPRDVDVRADYALTFTLQNPPEYEKAIAELKKSLADNPSHEKSLEFLTQASIEAGKKDEAANYLARLREINPENPNLSKLQSRIANGKNNTE